MIVTRALPPEPDTLLTLTSEESSKLMSVCNAASTNKDAQAAIFATEVYRQLKRLGVKLPPGHPYRGNE